MSSYSRSANVLWSTDSHSNTITVYPHTLLCNNPKDLIRAFLTLTLNGAQLTRGMSAPRYSGISDGVEHGLCRSMQPTSVRPGGFRPSGG